MRPRRPRPGHPASGPALCVPLMLPVDGPLLGLDLGARSVGVAVSDRAQCIAVAVETIRVARPTESVERLRALVRERSAVGLVVGLPLHLDGRRGSRAQSAQRVAGILADELDLPFVLWDERLSTQAVERGMIEADVSRARRHRGIDTESAVWMLQGFLDSPRETAD